MLKRSLPLCAAFVLALSTLSVYSNALASSPAHSQAESYRVSELAGIVEGTYRAENSDIKVIIKKEVSRYAVNFYALMIAGKKASLFKVDSIDGSTLAFTQYYMGEQQILKTNNESQPSYAVQPIFMDGYSLALSATQYGSNSGCPQSLRLKLDSDADEKWVSLADIMVQKLKVNKDAEIDLIMTSAGPMKEFSLTVLGGDDMGSSWSGQYLVREQIAGVGLMRKRQLDSMQTSGFSLTRHSSAVLVAMKSSSKKPVLKLMRMQAGQSACLTSTSNIK